MGLLTRLYSLPSARLTAIWMNLSRRGSRSLAPNVRLYRSNIMRINALSCTLLSPSANANVLFSLWVVPAWLKARAMDWTLGFDIRRRILGNLASSEMACLSCPYTEEGPLAGAVGDCWHQISRPSHASFEILTQAFLTLIPRGRA